MEDRLTEISIEDLKRLRDLYTPDGIKSYTAFVTIDNYLRWTELEQKTNKNGNIKFFCLNDDISNGTFVIIECNIVCGDTLNKSNDELFRLLLLLDYSKEFFFFSYSEHVAEAVRKAVQEKNVKIGMDDSVLFYYLPKEEALKFDIHHSDEIELKPLTNLSDLRNIYSLWPVADRNPFEFLLNATKYNPSVAVFTKDGTPVAWIFRHLSGLFMSLQTHKSYQKHGFGSLVTKALAKRVGELGHDSYTTIFDDNIASQNLYEKLGFQAKGKVYLLRTKVNKNDEDKH